jgi:hypothetical protein
LTAIATATFVRRNASGPLPEMQVDITTLHGRPDGRHIRWKGAKTIPCHCAISDAHFEHQDSRVPEGVRRPKWAIPDEYLRRTERRAHHTGAERGDA